MELYPYFKSIIDEDKGPVVICDLAHRVVYMNPAAQERYAKSGGGALVGKSLFDCHSPETNEKISKVFEWFKGDKAHNRIYIFYNEKENKDVYMVALRDEEGELIGYYEKHEYRNRETGERYQLD